MRHWNELGRAPAMLAAVLACCACSETDDPAQAAADVAQVRSMADSVPLVPLSPQRIAFADIDQNDLYGAGCGFAPGNGLAVMVIAQPQRAFMKLDGEIVDFAADKGSTGLPLGAWTRYDGRRHSIEIAAPEDGGSKSGIGTIDWRGTVTVRDAQGRAVYQSEGTLQCGS